MRWLLPLALLVPQPVWACSTCFDPKDGRQSNFLLPTLFMSLLPLTMLAAVGLWLWRAHKRAELVPVTPPIPFPVPSGVSSWTGSGILPPENR